MLRVNQFVFSFSLLLTITFSSHAQFNIVNHELEWMFDDYLSQGDTVLNSSNNSFDAFFVFDELPTDSMSYGFKSPFLNWLTNKNLYQVRKENYSFTFNSIANASLGTQDHLRAQRGAYVRGTIGSKFKWVSSYYETIQRYDPRFAQIVKQTAVAPGEGEVKNPFVTPQYAVSGGGMSYEFSKYYTLTAGHGKNFIGNGYRSLLLSDAASNYPFVRNDIKVGRVHYSHILAEFIDFTNNLGGDGLKQKKYGSFHYIDVLATKKLKLAFFEAVIWEADSGSRFDVDLNYLNPFVLFRPIEYNLGSPDNMLIGLNGSWDPFKQVNIYGQWVMDELNSENLLNNPTWWANKYGYQIGVKLHKLPIKNLVIQAEHNSVRPFTYTHRTSAKNYGHNYNALAHPYGANFREVVGIINYRWKRYNFNTRIVYLNGGAEQSDSVTIGTDIFRPYGDRESDNGYSIGSGDNYSQLFIDAKVNYIVNPKYFLMFEVGCQSRSEWLKGNNKNHYYLYAGLRTSLFNLYNDF